MLESKNLNRKIYLLLVIQLVFVSGVIISTERMGPVVSNILSDNVFSLEAIEEMLSTLAAPPHANSRKNFEASLDKAKGNVTEAQESPKIDRIEALYLHALQGDVDAKNQVIEALVELASLNRGAMVLADKKAKSVSAVAAWAAAITGLVSLVIGLALLRSINHYFVLPFEELVAVIQAWHDGNRRRRCSASVARGSLAELMRKMNEILDSKSMA